MILTDSSEDVLTACTAAEFAIIWVVAVIGATTLVARAAGCFAVGGGRGASHRCGEDIDGLNDAKQDQNVEGIVEVHVVSVDVTSVREIV